MKQKLLSISACALRSCLMNFNSMISFEKIHEQNKKCTPTQIMAYQAALKLHKTLNFELPNFEIVTVLDQMILSSRQTMFQILRNNSTKIGMNVTDGMKHYVTNGTGPLARLSLFPVAGLDKVS